jgi:general secretion pathway protein A
MSYYKVLGLTKEPFSTSPDPEFFYQSYSHKKALANILMEIRLKRGLSVVLGDIGTGKTTLSRKLLQLLKVRAGIRPYIILDPTYNT